MHRLTALILAILFLVPISCMRDDRSTGSSKGKRFSTRIQDQLDRDIFWGLLANNPTRARQFLEEENPLDDKEIALIKDFLDKNSVTQKKKVEESLFLPTHKKAPATWIPYYHRDSKDQSKRKADFKEWRQAAKRPSKGLKYKKQSTGPDSFSKSKQQEKKAAKHQLYGYTQTVPSDYWERFIQLLAANNRHSLGYIDLHMQLYKALEETQSEETGESTLEGRIKPLIQAIASLSVEEQQDAYKLLLAYGQGSMAQYLALTEQDKSAAKKARNRYRM